MKRILLITLIIIALLPAVSGVTEFVFWFNNTTTVFLTDSTTTISTVNATYGTIVAETTYITMTSTGTFTVNQATVLMHILVGNESMTKYRYFYVEYNSEPTNYSKLIIKSIDEYTNTTMTNITTIAKVTLTGATFGTQTLYRTIIISNTDTTTTFQQIVNSGAVYYTANSNFTYFKSITISLNSPSPIFGSIILWSNPFSTTVTGYLNGEMGGIQVYYTVIGTNFFTAIARLNDDTVTIVGDDGGDTQIYNQYTIENKATPTISYNGAFTIFNDPPFIIYEYSQVPIIIIPQKITTTHLSTINVFSYSQNLYIGIKTGNTTSIIAPSDIPAISFKIDSVSNSNGAVFVYGTLYYNQTSETDYRPLLVPNLYNAQNAYALFTTLTDLEKRLQTFTVQTLIINYPVKPSPLTSPPAVFIISNGNYGTIQKITMSIMNNGTITTLYEYTYLKDKVMITYFTPHTTIVYTTTMIMPQSTTTVYSNSRGTITLHVTLKSGTRSGVFLIETTTNFLLTTIIRPDTFSAVQQVMTTNGSTTLVTVMYTSPVETVGIISETFTVVMFLTLQPQAPTVIPASSPSSTTQAAMMTFTTTAPQTVKSTVGKSLSLLVYLALAGLFIALILSLFCIARADDDDAKKKCIIRLVLVIIAVIIILVGPHVLDWLNNA